MITYSIIIPHKNIPHLLQRCLQSIPQREDVEVIIVDDNSDEQIVNFAQFPGQDRMNTRTIFTKEGRGAGYARNVGLEHACGQWILFADADDYFIPNLSPLLDKYVESAADIVYFPPTSTVFISTGIESERVSTYQHLFRGNKKFLRYAYITPWGKMIRRELIERGGFRFHEVHWGNDTFFMTQVATSAQKVVIADEFLYVVDEREGSLTREMLVVTDEIRCRICEDVYAYKFAESVGFNPPDVILFGRILKLLHQKKYVLLMRTLRTLPFSAYRSIKKRMFDHQNVKGKFFMRILFSFSYFMPKL